jgi:hypothetical protein
LYYRHACILREGIKVARHEISRITQHLVDLSNSTTAQTQQPQSQSVYGEEEEDDTFGSGKKSVKSRRNAAKRAAASSSSGSNKGVEVDYGLQGEWEAVKDMCIESNGLLGGYSYKLCFFGELKQGSTLIGKYASWGLLDLTALRVSSILPTTLEQRDPIELNSKLN